MFDVAIIIRYNNWCRVMFYVSVVGRIISLKNQNRTYFPWPWYERVLSVLSNCWHLLFDCANIKQKRTNVAGSVVLAEWSSEVVLMGRTLQSMRWSLGINDFGAANSASIYGVSPGCTLAHICCYTCGLSTNYYLETTYVRAFEKRVWQD